MKFGEVAKYMWEEFDLRRANPFRMKRDGNREEMVKKCEAFSSRVASVQTLKREDFALSL